MQILIPDVFLPNTYIDDLASTLEELGHEVIWGSDNLFHSRWQPDAIASQWPEGYFRTAAKQGKFNLADLSDLESQLKVRREKSLIIAFVHNVQSRARVDRHHNCISQQLFAIAYSAAHAFIHLGCHSQSELETIYPASVYQGKPVLVVPHGLNERLRGEYQSLMPSVTPEQGFRIFVPGAIRSWQEANFVMQAFLKASIPDKQLVIAGGGSVLAGKYPLPVLRRTAIRSVPGISIFGRRLSDRELCQEILSSNVVVAPRLWATNSGIPYLAATFGKRCIGPRVGNLPEALDQLDGILFEPSSPSSLARALETAYEQRDRALNAACPSWSEIGKQIENFIFAVKAQQATSRF